MPPTWMVLVFFYITFHLSLLPTVIFGAVAATLGRVCLAYLARFYFTPFLSEEGRKNYRAIGKFINKNRKVSIPLILFIGLGPIPSDQAYIAVGMSGANVKQFAVIFFIARLFSYTFWIAGTRRLHYTIEGMMTGKITSYKALVFDFLGLIVLWGLSRIKWTKILGKYIDEPDLEKEVKPSLVKK